MFIMLNAEDDLDRRNWLAELKAPFQPTVEERPDQQGNPVLLLSAEEFEGITDHKALFEMGKARVRELNSIIGATSGASDVTVEGVAEVVDGVMCCHEMADRVVVRHLVMQAGAGTYEIKGGSAQFQILEPGGRPKPQPPSTAQEQYRAARLNDYIAEALAYTAGKPDFIDLSNALECLKAGGFIKKGDKAAKRFTGTANAIVRHRLGKFPLPNKPMTIDEARTHIRSLIDKAIESVLAANPLAPPAGRP